MQFYFFITAVHDELKKVYRNISSSFFLQNCKKAELEKKAFCVITFAPIEVTDPFNISNLNLSFVKDSYVDGEKVARNGRKIAI